ncbi:MAG TPA: acetylxylan esterase, partial [Armatimonadota bacterium]
MLVKTLITAFGWTLLLGSALSIAPPAHAQTPSPRQALDEYFAEPAGLPYDVTVVEKKQEDGWHWTEFNYTSIIYRDTPIRVHAVYAVPDTAGPAAKVPAILATHGHEMGLEAPKAGNHYWYVTTTFVKAGYAVLFIDWWPRRYTGKIPDDALSGPETPRHYTWYGNLEKDINDFAKGNDFKDSTFYQTMMAAKRGLTWLQAQPEVDGDKLAAYGASYGGIFSSLLYAIEPRLKAVSSQNFTADFGVREESWNKLPADWSDATVQTWRSRFDSYVLLQDRPGPILYTAGSNEFPPFLFTKITRGYHAMRGPKYLLIGPNGGHGYRVVEQSALFFDEYLKGKTPRPVMGEVNTTREGQNLVLSVKPERFTPGTVEFFVATSFERDPDRGREAIISSSWKWVTVPATRTADGTYTARWPLPVMRPVDPTERTFYWDTADALNVQDPNVLLAPPVEPEKLQGAVRVFARATAQNSAMTCAPLAEEVVFSDMPAPAKPADDPNALPTLLGAVRISKPTVIDITSTVEAGQPMATLACDLPVKTIGKSGYVLWNWRKNLPLATISVDQTATPTKRLLPPFQDTVKDNSFAFYDWAPN